MSVAQAAELGERLQRRLVAVGAPDAPAVVERLLRWLELHARWSRIGNLTGTRDTDTLVDLHLTDAAALHGLLPEGVLLDIGSGSGLPGLVLACLDPERELILLDAAQKRTRFLEQAALELGLDAVRVVTARCEDHVARLASDGPRPDAMIARAVAPLARLAEWTRPLLDVGVPFLAQKGPAWAEEAEALPAGIEVHSVRTYGLPDVERDHVLVCMAARTAVAPEEVVPATDAGEQGE